MIANVLSELTRAIDEATKALVGLGSIGRLLTKLDHLELIIMKTQQQLTQDVNALTAQVQQTNVTLLKVGTETANSLDQITKLSDQIRALQDQIASGAFPVSPELETAVGNLSTQVATAQAAAQKADDLVPDVTPAPPAVTPDPNPPVAPTAPPTAPAQP